MPSPESTPPPWRLPLDAARSAQPADPSTRYAQLATVRPDGRPANRTVVVRDLVGPSARPLFTSDARSAKLDDLNAEPRAELCWYFGPTREQFRLSGVVEVVGDDAPAGLASLRHNAWDALPDGSRRTFAWPPPGAPRADPAAFEGDTPVGPPAEFLVLLLDPEWVEHLDLRTHPHTRIRYVRDAKGGWSAEAVNP